MLTREQALELLAKRLGQLSPENDFVTVEEGTIEKPYGWVFFYNSRKYLETGEIRYAIAGNGPVIVNKHLGTTDFFGPVDWVKAIDEYERKLQEGH